MEVIKLGQFSEAILRAARLIDGTGLAPRENVNIHISGGIIRSILPDISTGLPGCEKHPSTHNPAEGTDPAGLPGCRAKSFSGEKSLRVKQRAQGTVEIDCSDLTILPGLIDCHVHLALDGVDFDASLKRWDNAEALSLHLAEALDNTLRSGILAIRDGGDRRLIGLQADRSSKNPASPPLVLATGEALRGKGKYGSFLGTGLTAGEIRAAVQRMATAGAAQIKVLVSGIVSFKEYEKVGPLQFIREGLELLVAEAHDLGLKVMAHASSDEGTALAVQCGVDSLEHGYFISRDTIARMAEKGISWVPTIIPVAAQTRKPLHNSYSSTGLAVVEKTYRRQQAMVETAHRLGVTIGAGTDAGASGVRHGLSYVEELQLLMEAGLSTAAVITAATASGAKIVGLDKQMGTVALGMPANLIGVPGNPLADLDLLKKPNAIFVPNC